jgi:hypothetical protein
MSDSGFLTLTAKLELRRKLLVLVLRAGTMPD